MKFEDAGRAVDREVAKLVEYFQQRVQPATRQDMAKLLCKTSERLAKLAEDLEKAEN